MSVVGERESESEQSIGRGLSDGGRFQFLGF